MRRPGIKKGSALLLSIIISPVFVFLSVFLLKIVYNSYVTVNAFFERGQAFWAAEAGLERGKVEMRHNPNWYTDLPHFPEEDKEWLKTCAVGQKTNLGKGWFKVVREKDKKCFYSLGFSGKAVVILKLEFDAVPLVWEEL